MKSNEIRSKTLRHSSFKPFDFYFVEILQVPIVSVRLFTNFAKSRWKHQRHCTCRNFFFQNKRESREAPKVFHFPYHGEHFQNWPCRLTHSLHFCCLYFLEGYWLPKCWVSKAISYFYAHKALSAPIVLKWLHLIACSFFCLDLLLLEIYSNFFHYFCNITHSL